MFRPYSKKLQDASGVFNKGNFGLWFNKLIPLNEKSCKPCDRQGNDKEVIPFYKSHYDVLRKNKDLKDLLDEKHRSQISYCATLVESGYAAVMITAQLISPLITGMGQPHPNEIGMIFDHTMGIPYIPSSGIKGITRFAHTLGLLNSKDLSKFTKN